MRTSTLHAAPLSWYVVTLNSCDGYLALAFTLSASGWRAFLVRIWRRCQCQSKQRCRSATNLLVYHIDPKMLRLILLIALFCLFGSSIAMLEEETPVGWPFRNRTASKSCIAYTTCTSCSDASWCHWCDSDETCHVMGSIHGCISGSNCQPKPEPQPDRNDTSGCYAHETCSECALASHLCHWCAHDNRCHVIGSLYGCSVGVDCYSNDRCMRKEPEPFHHVTFTKIGYLPSLLILVTATICCCCSTSCFCVAGGLKGAYDDLANLANPDAALEEPLLPAAPATPPDAPEANGSEPAEATEEDNDAHDAPETDAEDAAEEGHAEGYVSIVAGSDDEEEVVVHRSRPRPKHMQRLYNACATCYIITVALTVAFVWASFRYYPKVPTYNICNDSVAWKSLIDSLTSMTVTADFEILASVSNPNHIDVALDMGQGSFTHNGAFVGTFDIPPVTVKAMSVTDIMIVAHLSPDKWDALSLTAEYYRGKLVLHVDAQATIRVPALADYSFATSLQDIVVHVNEMSDRHLCACPDWEEAKNNSKPVWAEPDFLQLA